MLVLKALQLARCTAGNHGADRERIRPGAPAQSGARCTPHFTAWSARACSAPTGAQRRRPAGGHYYSLTAAGRRVLSTEQEHWERLSRAVTPRLRMDHRERLPHLSAPSIATAPRRGIRFHVDMQTEKTFAPGWAGDAHGSTARSRLGRSPQRLIIAG